VPSANPVPEGIIEVDMLDVGQGLAVLVGSEDFLMVYDTGPGNGLLNAANRDAVSHVVQPAIARRTIAPDVLVVSHADLDHAGGLKSLRDIWPDTRVVASVPHFHGDVQTCLAGDEWGSGNLLFQVLHPSAGLPYLGNDSSCVISVRSPEFSLLLTGDISKAVERRLIMQSVQAHKIMLVPHHGSASSSSQRFIEAVNPELALNSAANHNRFDFPRLEVMQRFSNTGVAVLNTANCGGLRITTTATADLNVQSARIQRAAIWRFGADGFCP